MNCMILSQFESISRIVKLNSVNYFINVSNFYLKYYENCLKWCGFPVKPCFFVCLKN